MPPLTVRESAHHDFRGPGVRPSLIILHYTDTQSLEEAEDYFLGRRAHPGGGRVSTHYMIAEDGGAVRYVPEERRAWHAGVSFWDGIRDVNACSVGIELVNPGLRYGYRPFTAAQMETLVPLCRGIMDRYGIPPERVLAHSDVAPARRADPGELFDWRALAAAGCALWPDPQDEDYAAARDGAADPGWRRATLTALGYDPGAPEEAVLTAFRRHFHPEFFTPAGGDAAEMDARLHWLRRRRAASS